MNHPISSEHPNFTWPELTCRHCGLIIVDDHFWAHMDLLQQLRAWWGSPFIVTSGHRCPSYNADVGGALGSQHLRFATDFIPSVKSPRLKFAVDQVDEPWAAPAVMALDLVEKEAEALGFRGIGRYEEFLQVDLRDGDVARWDDREDVRA